MKLCNCTIPRMIIVPDQFNHLMANKWMDDLQFYILFNSISDSSEDDERLIMKDCVQWNPVYS